MNDDATTSDPALPPIDSRADFEAAVRWAIDAAINLIASPIRNGSKPAAIA